MSLTLSASLSMENRLNMSRKSEDILRDDGYADEKSVPLNYEAFGVTPEEVENMEKNYKIGRVIHDKMILKSIDPTLYDMIENGYESREQGMKIANYIDNDSIFDNLMEKLSGLKQIESEAITREMKRNGFPDRVIACVAFTIKCAYEEEN